MLIEMSVRCSPHLPCLALRQVSGRGKWVISCGSRQVFFLLVAPCPALPCPDRTFCLTYQLTPLVEYIIYRFVYSKLLFVFYSQTENKSSLFAGKFTVQMFGMKTFCKLSSLAKVLLLSFPVNKFYFRTSGFTCILYGNILLSVLPCQLRASE